MFLLVAPEAMAPIENHPMVTGSLSVQKKNQAPLNTPNGVRGSARTPLPGDSLMVVSA